MLRARHLCSMQVLNLCTAFAQLPNHVIKVASKIADLVVAFREINFYLQIAFSHQRYLVLQLDHWTTHDDGEHHHHHGANCHCTCRGHNQYDIAFRISQRKSDQDEQQETVDEDGGHRQQRFQLPVHAETVHVVP